MDSKNVQNKGEPARMQTILYLKSANLAYLRRLSFVTYTIGTKLLSHTSKSLNSGLSVLLPQIFLNPALSHAVCLYNGRPKELAAINMILNLHIVGVPNLLWH